MHSSGVDDHLTARRAPPPSFTTMDEEAQKRNTDCVYFLASPLTCKKGSSCEYRHSEAARMNPRDCWFWIHSDCLNPNCSFRHPPLEGRPVSSSTPQSPALVASAVAITVPSASAASTSGAAVASKSKKPCFFFSQGVCAKGDKCPFMHSPSVVSSTDVAAQQKPPKGPHGKAVQANSQPVAVLKGNGLILQKQTFQETIERRTVARIESQPVPSKALVSAHVSPQILNDPERARIPESSVTSTPSRHEKVLESRKSKKTQPSDDRFHDIQDPVDRSRKGQPGGKWQQQPQREDERLQPVQAADQRNQNGFRSDAWWKEASSGLEGNGSDQLTQREDGEYSPQSESRGRMKGFEPLNTYGQAGSDGISAQHKQHRYKQHPELRVDHGYDHMGSSEHTRHRSFSSSARTGVRDGKRAASEGRTTTSDLRDLLKLRRNDSGHHRSTERLSRRGQPDMVDNLHRSQRLSDDYPKQENQRGGEIHRRPSGRADSRGVKRPHQDGGSSPDSLSLRTSPNRHLGTGESPADRVLLRSSPNKRLVTDHSRIELKDKERDRYPSEVAPVSDARGHLVSKSTRQEYTKEASGFTGPKSLAQIKAERTAERGLRRKHLEAHSKLAYERSAVSAKSRDLTASTSKFGRMHTDRVLTGKKGTAFEYNSANSEDFEGPKPLSFLLKEKQKVESDGDAEEAMTGSNKAEVSMADLSREMEDGEVRYEEDGWKHENSHNMYPSVASLQEELTSRSLSDTNEEGTLEGVLRCQGLEAAQDDMESSEDGLRLGVETGENASGDDEYGLDDDDDDEDDFAKKLGGFFS